MNVAITGGLGFIGSHLAERFAAAGDKVWIVDDQSGNVVKASEMMEVDGVQDVAFTDVAYWAGSACAGDESFFDRKYDLVVHCAAPVGPGRVSELGGTIAWSIIEATTAIGGVCAAAKTPLVNVSSSEVYGATLDAMPEESDSPVGHRGEYTARSEYGMAKALAENVLANIKGLHHTNLRLFNTAGPRQSSLKGFVLPTFVTQVKAHVPLTVYEPDAYRSFTSVHDVTRFIVDHWQVAIGRGSFNVGSEGNGITIRELAQLVINVHIEQTGSDGRWVESDPQERWGPAYAFFQQANGIKFPRSRKAAALGWEPRVGLRDVVVETYRSIP